MLRPLTTLTLLLLSSSIAQAGGLTTTTSTTTTSTTSTTLPAFSKVVPHIGRGTFNSNNLFARDRIHPFGLEQGWTTWDLGGITPEMVSTAKVSWTSTWDENNRQFHGMNLYVLEDPEQEIPDGAGHVFHTFAEGCYGPGNESQPTFDENCPTHTAFLFDAETDENDTGEVAGCNYLEQLTCSPVHDVTARLQELLEAGATRVVVVFFSHNKFWRIDLDPLPELTLYGDAPFPTTTSTTTSTTVSTSTTSTSTTTLPPGPTCGDPADTGAATPLVREGGAGGFRVVTANDALFVLKAAVGAEECQLCVCDVNSSGGISAGDALTVLKFAVGGEVVLDCPPCLLE